MSLLWELGGYLLFRKWSWAVSAITASGMRRPKTLSLFDKRSVGSLFLEWGVPCSDGVRDGTSLGERIPVHSELPDVCLRGIERDSEPVELGVGLLVGIIVSPEVRDLSLAGKEPHEAGTCQLFDIHGQVSGVDDRDGVVFPRELWQRIAGGAEAVYQGVS